MIEENKEKVVIGDSYFFPIIFGIMTIVFLYGVIFEDVNLLRLICAFMVGITSMITLITLIIIIISRRKKNE